MYILTFYWKSLVWYFSIVSLISWTWSSRAFTLWTTGSWKYSVSSSPPSQGSFGYSSSSGSSGYSGSFGFSVSSGYSVSSDSSSSGSSGYSDFSGYSVSFSSFDSSGYSSSSDSSGYSNPKEYQPLAQFYIQRVLS